MHNNLIFNKMKKISKTNEEIYSLLDRLQELADYDVRQNFDTRSGKICANIKVYEWLDYDDVLKVCNDLNIKKTKKILKEFNEERLNSIYYHTCESEINQIKEELEENVDITDFEKVFRVGRVSIEKVLEKDKFIENRPELKYYIGEYWDKAKSFSSFEDFKKHIIEGNKREFEEWYKRSLIDFDVWQYGRSGGWLSLCDEDELNFRDLGEYEISWRLIEGVREAYQNDNNHAFNQALLLDDWTAKDKPSLIKAIENLIEEAEEKIQAVEYFIAEIESRKEYFKSSLLERLSYEIEDFQGWQKDYNVTVRVDGEVIKTSLGVTVPLQEFKANFVILSPTIEKLKKKEKMTIGRKVGNYFVEWAEKKKSDTIIKAGCHRFSYNQIKQTIEAAI